MAGPSSTSLAERSGIWVQQLLQSHPMICGGEESHFLFDPPRAQAEKWEDRKQRKSYIDRKGDALWTLWGRIFAELYGHNPDALVHLEKMAENSHHLNGALRLFPAARIAHVNRATHAVVASYLHASKRLWATDTTRRAVIRCCSWNPAIQKGRRSNTDHPYPTVRYKDIQFRRQQDGRPISLLAPTRRLRVETPPELQAETRRVALPPKKVQIFGYDVDLFS